MVVALTVAAVSGRPEPRKLKSSTEEFADFKVKFGKVYRDIREEASRFRVFQVQDWENKSIERKTRSQKRIL